jgi:hypothetical protein
MNAVERDIPFKSLVHTWVMLESVYMAAVREARSGGNTSRG